MLPAGQREGSRDLLQNLRKTLGHIEHNVVAARQLVNAPISLARAGEAGIEIRISIAKRTNVGFLTDPFAGAGQAELLQPALDRLRRALRVDPSAIVFIDVEQFGAARRHGCGAGADRDLHHLAHLRRDYVEHGHLRA